MLDQRPYAETQVITIFLHEVWRVGLEEYLDSAVRIRFDLVRLFRRQ